MTDQVAPVVPATIEPSQPATPVQPTASEPTQPATAEHMIPKSRLDEEIKKKEAAEKELKKFQEAENKKKESEMTALQLAEKKIADLEKQTKADALDKLRRKVGEAAKLPAEIYELLPEATEEEMKAKAEALAKALPTKNLPTITPTNPGGNAQETAAQKKERLLGSGTDIWGGK